MAEKVFQSLINKNASCADCAWIPARKMFWHCQADELVFANPQNCTYCTTCEETCPEDAVRCEFEIRWAS